MTRFLRTILSFAYFLHFDLYSVFKSVVIIRVKDRFFLRPLSGKSTGWDLACDLSILCWETGRILEGELVSVERSHEHRQAPMTNNMHHEHKQGVHTF